MKFIQIITAAAVLAVAAPVVAQEAQSLDQLLQQVRRGAANDQADNRKRIEEFQRDQANQQRLLNQARSERASLERRGEELEALFESNNTQIGNATAELNERLGSLKELFGVLQQVAGDTQSVFNSSLTNIQYPDRSEFLVDLGTKMASTTQLASIEDIEQLWYEIQREMTETGKVSKFTTAVTLAGESQQVEVVRVGAFNVVADGKYLNYSAATQSVAELPRQPSASRFTGSTSDLFGGGESATFGIDPSGGGILAQLVDSPTIRERVDQGGIVGYCIIGLGILGLLIAIFLLMTLTSASSKVTSQLKNIGSPNKNNPLGRVLATYDANRAVDTETVELKLSEAVMKETSGLTRGLLFLKVIAAVAPLAGLLGTVTGMIKTFQVITLYGAGDPKLMAGGISQALMTTVLGLVVAIPMILLHTFLNGRSRRVLSILQEQSAGLIAEHSEKSHQG